MPPKRKRSSAANSTDVTTPAPATNGTLLPPPLPRPDASQRKASAPRAGKATMNPDTNGDILDAPDALRASPDSDVNESITPGQVKLDESSESPLSEVPEIEPPKKKKKAAAPSGGKKTGPKEKAHLETEPKTPPAAKAKANKNEDGAMDDPEADGQEEAGEEEVKEASSRAPPVNSSYLPLPWKGRLGYACLCTYLRYSNPPVFSSRTCRIASILEHRHPLKDPSQPEHPTKNRPDRDQPADVALGQKYVEQLCIANVKDIAKMIRWNDRYGIKFLRLSSEMFPFASHEEYGYELAPFAADALAEAGKVIAELGHRVTTHPGQFTQLGSPRKSVIDGAVRDLAYHDEMLSLLKLPEQLNKDAVMILHLGGVFGDKAATLDRFRENYAKLPHSVKNRLVLENDDVSWSVHELLPICEELNIPMVLDYHHNNIIFDSTQMREGTADIINLYPRIRATWTRKGITQKMHYSEPTPAAITGRQRRKHNPRVATMPPCADDMDLMIEAKDKEQAVFELMRTFKLPGYDTFNDVIPHVRQDDNKMATQEAEKEARKKATPKKGAAKKGKKVKEEAEEDDEDVASVPEVDAGPALIPDDEVGMGGPEGRVYWPPGQEEWLRPKKREVKKKEPSSGPTKPLTTAQLKQKKAEAAALQAATLEAVAQEEDVESDEGATPATKKAKAAIRQKVRLAKAKAAALANGDANGHVKIEESESVVAKSKPKAKPKAKPKVKKEPKEVLTPLTSDAEDDEPEEPSLESEDEEVESTHKRAAVGQTNAGKRKSGRATKVQVGYAEGDVSMEEA